MQMNYGYAGASINSIQYPPVTNGANYIPYHMDTVMISPQQQVFENATTQQPITYCEPLTSSYPVTYSNMEHSTKASSSEAGSGHQQQQRQQQQQHVYVYAGEPITAMTPQQVQLEVKVEHKYIVIFDWDDTIFPTTSFIRRRNRMDATHLEEFGKAAYDVLSHAMHLFGEQNIFIVTNGIEGWVQRSLEIFVRMQSAHNALNMGHAHNSWSMIKDIITRMEDRIFSARQHERLYPDQPTLWKSLVFRGIASQHFGVNPVDGINGNGTNHIISIGDSTQEYIASLHTMEWLQQNRICGVNRSTELIRIKLKQHPSTQMMVNQFHVICGLYYTLSDRQWHSSFDFDMDLPSFIHRHNQRQRQ